MDTDVLARLRKIDPRMAAQAAKDRAADAVSWVGRGKPGRTLTGAVGVGSTGVASGNLDAHRSETCATVGGSDGGRANARVVIVADHGTKGLIATSDPHDGAHSRMDPLGKLVPAAVGPVGEKRLGKHAKPRQYPPSHFGTGSVPLDSSFDAAYERAEWLKRELGIDLVGITHATAMEQAIDRVTADGVHLHDLQGWGRTFRRKL